MSEQVKPASDHEYVQIPSHIENDETGEVIPFDGGEVPDGFTALFRYCQPASEQKPDGQWVRCTPELIHAGVCCDKTPRRPGDGSYSHDHFISHAAPQLDYKAQRDAERYRWLREQHWNESNMCVVLHPKNAVRLGHECPSDNRLDAYIDAAIASVKGGA